MDWIEQKDNIWPSDNKAFLQTPQDASIPREDGELADAEYIDLAEEIYEVETESEPEPVLDSEPVLEKNPESSETRSDTPVISRSALVKIDD